MPKNELSTKGIVIRETTIGEADKLLTLLTPDLGRITVRCRGVRTLKSRRFAASQLYAYSDILLSEKDGRYSLEEAEVLGTFFDLRSRLDSLACANYFADLLNTVTVEGEGDPAVMSLFLNALYLLAKGDKPCRLIKAVFEARLLLYLGIMPDLSACADCQKTDFALGWLDVAGGVPLCADCAMNERPPEEGERILLPLSSSTLQLLRYLFACEGKKIFSFSCDETLLEELSRITERYLLYHTGREFETLTFLRMVL